MPALLSDNDILLIDTRPWEEYRAGHPAGALHAPVNSVFPTLAGSFVQPTDRVCLIVRREHLDEAVLDFMRVGLDNVEFFIEPNQLPSAANGNGQFAKIEEISAGTFAERLELQDTFVLDVRGDAELRRTGWVRNALNVAHVQLPIRSNELPRDCNIHVYCESGSRSRYSCGYLQRLGHKVTYVDGGIVDWKARGFPVETA
jgi:hydroxyacylglutathione hydrolase